MKRMLVRTGVGILGILMLAVAGIAATAQARWDRTFEAPEPDLRASTDPALVQQGRYLVYGPAHCSYCHTPPADWPRLDAGEELPLVGGY
jgi:mono/diheme cytochrome c family protein